MPWNDRDAHYQGTSSGCSPGIFQNAFIGDSGKPFVQTRIQMFDVKIYQIQMMKQLLQMFPLYKSTGFNSRVYVALPALLQKLGYKIVLHSGFAAADRDPAIGSPVKGAVFLNFLEQLRYGHNLSGKLQSLVGAGLDTFVAASAAFPVNS